MLLIRVYLRFQESQIKLLISKSFPKSKRMYRSYFQHPVYLHLYIQIIIFFTSLLFINIGVTQKISSAFTQHAVYLYVLSWQNPKLSGLSNAFQEENHF